MKSGNAWRTTCGLDAARLVACWIARANAATVFGSFFV